MAAGGFFVKTGKGRLPRSLGRLIEIVVEPNSAEGASTRHLTSLLEIRKKKGKRGGKKQRRTALLSIR